ncbi:MAG: oligoendopeptidase F [Bacteroidia bacterium]|nr:oligoendopeptidase F [Bacteroidia bacterium]
MSNTQPLSVTLPTRDEADPANTWRLEALYSSLEAWEEDFGHLDELIAKLDQFRGTLGESGETLLAWFRFADTLNVLAGKVGNYAFRRFDENTANTLYQGLTDRVMSQHTRMSAATAWVVPELLEIPPERVSTFLAEVPDLRIYEHHLDEVLRMRAHVLSQREEELLALSLEATGAAANIFGMFNDADIRFGTIQNEDGTDVEVTKGRYIQLQESHHRQVRKAAFDALYGAYAGWKNTLAAMLNSQVKREMFYARARGYESTLHMALYEDNIPAAVYDNVVSTVNDNLAPLHRAMELRRRVLGLEHVRPWDLYLPLGGDMQLSIPWEDARRMVGEALAPLGADYVRDLTEGLHGGWIDVYENQGKTSGAYSAWTYGAHPFVLMNYTNTLKDVFTLAHEMGHSMHSYYTWKAQPPVYGGYTIFCAEVASTCNELLLVRHLLDTRPEAEVRANILLHHIDTIRGTVYNQALFAEFERFIHREAEEGRPLTVDLMSGKMEELYVRYYGPAFQTDPLFALNWARIPHFYRSFYVFQYATGLAAAAAISQRILEEGDAAMRRYRDFLASGSSKYSIELLKLAGVDMTSPDPIAATARLMDSLLDEAEALLP